MLAWRKSLARPTMYVMWRRRSLSPAGFQVYWRRDLPHFVPDGGTVFVTWRLAGTLPPPKTGQPISDLTAGAAFAEADRALDRSQSGPLWLQDNRVAAVVASALIYGQCAKRWYDLHAWVVMPNHVHVVIQPHGHLSDTMRWLKAATANRANRILNRRGDFWQREYYDRWVRSGDELRSIVRYVEWNPVTAGFVPLPEKWLWSSATKPPAARPPVPHGETHGSGAGTEGRVQSK
jgi:REP element-mobilizing transposase RayT